MNLPIYSLSDNPPSAILNLCLGIPSPDAPFPLPVSQRGLPAHNQNAIPIRKPRSSPAQRIPSSDDAPHVDCPEADDQWQDLEFRSPRPSTLPNTTASPLPADAPSENFASQTGWDEAFATANDEGWTLYGTYPLRVLAKHVVRNGSLRIVLPLHRTNILFLVGGPPSPLYSPNKVVVYDAARAEPVAALEFPAPVRGLAARRDLLAVALPHRVVLFSLQPTMCETASWETCANPRGLVCVSSGAGSSLLVFPGRQPGKVQVVRLPPFDPARPPAPPLACPSTAIFVAHTTALARLAITPAGTLIATASVTGTIIRIWDAKSSALVRELRRGTDGAEIWGLRFRPDGLALCASSDKGTVHVWDLRPNTRAEEHDGKAGRPLALLKPYLPKYFHSSWSDAVFRLPAPAPPPGRTLPSVFGCQSEGAGRERAATVEDDVSVVCWVVARPLDEPQVVAITRSGGWFRLRMPVRTARHSEPEDKAGNSAAAAAAPGAGGAGQTGGTRNPLATIGQDKNVELECVEYRRLGEDEEWSDDEYQES